MNTFTGRARRRKALDKMWRQESACLLQRLLCLGFDLALAGWAGGSEAAVKDRWAEPPAGGGKWCEEGGVGASGPVEGDHEPAAGQRHPRFSRCLTANRTDPSTGSLRSNRGEKPADAPSGQAEDQAPVRSDRAGGKNASRAGHSAAFEGGRAFDHQHGTEMTVVAVGGELPTGSGVGSKLCRRCARR